MPQPPDPIKHSDDPYPQLRKFRAGRRFALLLACFTAASGHGPPALPAVPLVLHTSNYEALVHGGPGDLIMIGGYGFTASDRVVYQADTPNEATEHPATVPTQVTSLAGTAPVLLLGSDSDSLTARLPSAVQAGQSYRLWVINNQGQWSSPMRLNDPRPLWISPSYVYETTDVAGLGRHIRVIGRNLEPRKDGPLLVRLRGPAMYTLESSATGGKAPDLGDYVAEVALPARLAVGLYSISVSRDGRSWTQLPTQQLEVRPDPGPLPRFSVDDPRFGGCHPDDAIDDGNCLARAIAAAQAARGGVVVIPQGVWDLGASRQFTLPPNVHLFGAGAARSGTILRHDAKDTPPSEALFTLSGRNSIVGITFSDTDHIESPAQSRAVIRLGDGTPPPGRGAEIGDIVISDNDFHRVGRAIVDSGQPIVRLFVTRNDFAAYDAALELGGNRYNVTEPYRIEDSIVRWNRFVPGSYIDISARQGTLASELGASRRVDFSSNVADGASATGLQRPDDPKGWRAAYFWNMNGNHEYLLVSKNRITCPGDKVGDGEAIAFDGNGGTYAFRDAQAVVASTVNSVVVHGALLQRQNDRAVDPRTYYIGQWIQIVQGRGMGQARKIEKYEVDTGTGTVVFHVAPGWDVVPDTQDSRIIVGREYWQAYAVANEVDQSSPLCQKSNLSGPSGGGIVMWAPSADSVIALNRQRDSNGISFQQTYSSQTESCKSCDNSSAVQFALEITENVIDGEYDWSSDCSSSGITAAFSAAPTPESAPPTLGFGIAISRNSISHADGLRGGAIDFASTWYRGPAPYDWPLVRNIVIFGNTIRNLTGPVPRQRCGYGQRVRTGIRMDGPGNIRDVVLSDNHCQNVDLSLDDPDSQHIRACALGTGDHCECSGSPGNSK